MKITKKHIQLAIKAGACRSGLTWAQNHIGHDLEDVRPDWTLWAVGEIGVIVSPKRLDWCAEQEPLSALVYSTALLTSERLDWCRKQI